MKHLGIITLLLLLLCIFAALMLIGDAQADAARRLDVRITALQQQIADLDIRTAALQGQVKDLRYQLCRGLDEGRCVEAPK
ncbi:hypothetical protein D4S03_10130 [bacterium]|nr:MAG: hypothetical protein D4S03_10130 [bacterium]